jgi:hypothetical protein
MGASIITRLPHTRWHTRPRPERVHTVTRAARPARAIKAAIVALLVGNTAWYAVSGNLSQTLDAAGWLSLLLLFEAESHPAARSWLRVLRLLRFMAAIGIGWSTLAYYREQAWLDAANATLWLAVWLVLELEFRSLSGSARQRLLHLTAGVLYASIGAMVLLWAWDGRWFHAYDAALWIVAFVIIEMDGMASSQPPA